MIISPENQLEIIWILRERTCSCINICFLERIKQNYNTVQSPVGAEVTVSIAHQNITFFLQLWVNHSHSQIWVTLFKSLVYGVHVFVMATPEFPHGSFALEWNLRKLRENVRRLLQGQTCRMRAELHHVPVHTYRMPASFSRLKPGQIF